MKTGPTMLYPMLLSFNDILLYLLGEALCPESPEILKSSELNNSTSGENILESCNNDMWKAPIGKTGDDAEIIIDIKCPIMLETFTVRNGFSNFGINKATMIGSPNIEGPWIEMFAGDFQHGNEMTEEVRCCFKRMFS